MKKSDFELTPAELKLFRRLNTSGKIQDFINKIPINFEGDKKDTCYSPRTILKKPYILFADEPCANLDTKSSEQVLDVLKDLNKKHQQTIVMVTHEPWHLKYVSRIIELKDGLIVKDKRLKIRFK